MEAMLFASALESNHIGNQYGFFFHFFSLSFFQFSRYYTILYMYSNSTIESSNSESSLKEKTWRAFTNQESIKGDL